MYRIKESNKKIILSLSWRDIKSPKAGGAEVHTHEMLRRLDQEIYRVYHISMANQNRSKQENIDGVNYIRRGNPITVILAAFFFYKMNRRNIDYVIDQCNTHRFFTPFWVKREKRIFYIHQLTKEIWDYSASFPLNKIGKALEEWMLRLNRKDYVITVSESTRDELVDRGYQKDKIRIIHNGVSFEPWEQKNWFEKQMQPTFIYVGRYSPYKGINVSVEALAKVKKIYPGAQLWILGKKNKEFVDKYLMPICEKSHMKWEDATDDNPTGDIVSWGFVSEEKKLELISRAHALVFPSIREGWGIPITEAGCVGTPSIAFDSSGIREAVDYGKAGYLCYNKTAEGLAEQMRLVISQEEEYSRLRNAAYQFSSQFRWDEIGKELQNFLESM